MRNWPQIGLICPQAYFLMCSCSLFTFLFSLFFYRSNNTSVAKFCHLCKMCKPQQKFSLTESSSLIVSTGQQRIEQAQCIVKQCAGLFCTLDRFLASFTFSFAILLQVRMISCPSPINRQLLIKRLQRVQFSGWSFLAGTFERSHDYAILYPHDPRLPWTTKYFHANLVEDVFDLGFSENWRMAMMVRTMMMWCGRMIIEHLVSVMRMRMMTTTTMTISPRYEVCRVPLIIAPNVPSIRGELALQCVAPPPKKLRAFLYNTMHDPYIAWDIYFRELHIYMFWRSRSSVLLDN